MASSATPTILAFLTIGLILLCAAGLAAAQLAGLAAAQNCDCQPGYCCSKYGYCGTTNDYCGPGCQSGPCSSRDIFGGSGVVAGVIVGSGVTDAFFNSIKSQDNGCEGKNFYTRRAFLNAANTYPGLALGGSETEGKREIAAFFANVAHETGRLCFINKIDGASRNYCDPNNRQWPCVPGEKYYGRGPLQISWNYNYGPAGRSIGFDGRRNPDKVAQDPVISFKTALWFWMNNVQRVMPQGFGATIRAINGNLECNGKNPGAVNSRVNYYKQYCRQIGVDPGNNLTC